jgi:transcriptional regulator with XRE-family HTH domain
MLRLRAERLRRGWSQTHVTILTGIASPDVSAIERGVRYAPPGWRRRLAVAFKVPEAELFAEVPDEVASA